MPFKLFCMEISTVQIMGGNLEYNWSGVYKPSN